MSHKSSTSEQIISMLQGAEVSFAQEEMLERICRRLGVSEQNYDQLRKVNGKCSSLLEHQQQIVQVCEV